MTAATWLYVAAVAIPLAAVVAALVWAERRAERRRAVVARADRKRAAHERSAGLDANVAAFDAMGRTR